MSTGDDGTLNTTEHILRQLEAILDELRKEHDEFKWDFPSFIVTLVIGIIAAVFAGVAIVQTLLAAGPGRLKSGKYAIGPWSKLTRRRFGSELRLRTTSETPVIAFESANWDPVVREVYVKKEVPYETHGKAPDWGPTWLELLLSVIGTTSRRRRARRALVYGPIAASFLKVPQDYFPATWLALLTTLGLDEPSFWVRKRVAADYIPSDLPAVPAHGRVRDITNLVLVACRGTTHLDFGLDTGHRLPLVRGNDMGLSFRHHPLLGLVGSFDLLRANKVTFGRRSLATALCLAHGIGCFGPVGGPMSAVSYTSSSNYGSEILSFFEEIFTREPTYNAAREFIIEGCLQQENKQTLARHHWLCLESGDCSVFPRVSDSVVEEQRQYLAIAFAAMKPGHINIPLVFPIVRAKIHTRLPAFVIQSRMWSSGLTCFDIAFQDVDWEDGTPEYPPKSHLLNTVNDLREGQPGPREWPTILGGAFDTHVWRELSPLASLTRNQAVTGERKGGQRLQSRAAIARTHIRYYQLILAIDTFLEVAHQAVRREWNCAAYSISWTAWAIEHLAQELGTLTRLMERERMLMRLSRQPRSRGNSAAEAERIRKGIRSRWVEKKESVRAVLRGQPHPKSMLATLETIVGMWERDWPEIRENPLPEDDENRSGVDVGSGREGGEEGTSNSDEEGRLHKPTQGNLHVLSDLIIYRAILVVALLSTALDNTAILEDPSLERIVPFI